MNKFSLPLSCALLLASLGAQATSANDVAGNLVKNGSMNPGPHTFDTGTGSTAGSVQVPDGWTDLFTSNHASDINNFTEVKRAVPYNSTPNGTTPQVGVSTDTDGGYFYSVLRGGNFPGFGPVLNEPNQTQGIFQKIDGLTVGHVYQLSFAYGGQTNYRWETSPWFWSVSFMGQTQDSAAPDYGIYYSKACESCQDTSDYKIGTFKTAIMSFTANATSSVLQFAVSMPMPNAMPSGFTTFLDGVTLVDTTPVPEPSSVTLILAGVSSLLLLVRRRTARRPG